MKRIDNSPIPYDEAYAAQLPVLGAQGQQRLREARVHVVSAGRVGGTLTQYLAAAGVGALSNNDPQVVDPDNLNSFAFSYGDIGTKKVKALSRRLALRDHSKFLWIALPVEADEVDPYIEASDLVICCANTVTGRVAAEQKAVRYGKPTMQVGVFDGRDRLGGTIALHLPANPWSACAGCYLDMDRERILDGALLSTVASALAAIAANMAVAILSGVRAQVFREKNLFYVDLETYAIEALAVEKRSGCPLCGKFKEAQP
jgi:molybdopterin/thiamine biosynthesis adenylyltransferase